MALNIVTTFITEKQTTLQKAVDAVEAFLETLDKTEIINNISFQLVDKGKYFNGIVVHGASPPASLWQKLVEDGQGFNVTTGTLTSGTSETDILLLRNPVASGKHVRVKDFIPSILEAGSNVRSIIRVYGGPTITLEGTALTINKKRTSQTDTSIATVFSLPTISARGSFVNEFTIDNSTIPLRDSQLSAWVEEGEDVLITFENTSNNTDISIFTQWAEVDL